MQTKNKIITTVLLTAGAITGTAMINKYIKFLATKKDLLAEPKSCCFRWRLGNIFYTKSGSGKPLLLIHDLNHMANSNEWKSVIPELSKHYTVYAIDLLGCGRSEKPNLTYTNFLYVQLIHDFVKSEIGRRTNVIASGSSSSIVTMACNYNTNLFDRIMMINPESFSAASQIPGKYAKLYKLILDTPIIGTLLYNIASSRKNIKEYITYSCYSNPYDVKPELIDQYYEAAHLGASPKSIYSSDECNYTKCRITSALEKINNSIYIVGGEDEPNINDIIKDYVFYNPAIESSIIERAKHLPHLEHPEEVVQLASMFFN